MRRWLSASIGNRITLAAAALTTVVVLLLGVISYGAVSALIRGNVGDALQGHAVLAGEVMEAELSAFSKELESLASNTLVVTGLLDAAGRDMHLLPFLRDYKPSIGARAAVAVCDFRGRPIAANQGGSENLCGSHPAVRGALETGKAHAQIVRDAERAALLLVQPMFYPATSQVEGALAGMVDLRKVFLNATASLDRKYHKRLLASGSKLAGDAAWTPGDKRVSVSRALKLAPALDGLKLQVDIGLMREDAFAALRWVMAAYVGVGALMLVLAFWTARGMARRLTAPIVALSDTAERIALGGSMAESAPAGGNDEVGRLALVFNDMLRRLRDSHEHMERQVQERTAALLKSQKELFEAHELLAEADRMETVGRLAAGVAHEVKNPLGIIRLGTDYLAQHFSQGSSQEVVDDIRAAIDRAERVIRDLLNFSRQNPFALRPTDIDEVIDEAINLTRHEIQHRNVAIIRNGDDPIPPISADPNRLVQVFINLLSNAAQAIGRDGRIEIVTRSICLSERDLERSRMSVFSIGEPVVTVDFRDNGPGISAEHEKRLFEPFFTTKPVGEGSGLGLAVSHGIVMKHRGSISVSNRPEGGASALLMFRVDREHLANEKANTGSR